MSVTDSSLLLAFIFVFLVDCLFLVFWTRGHLRGSVAILELGVVVRKLIDQNYQSDE
jgi:hypothetical protein